jgi:beta-lactamase class A
VIRHIFVAWLAFWIAAPAFAGGPSPEFKERAAMLPAVLTSGGTEREFFSPSFLTQVPAKQVRETARQLVAQYGPVRNVEALRPASPLSGVIWVGYEKAVVRFEMTVDDRPPHQVIGLQVVGVDARDDSAQKLVAEFQALSGRSGLVIVPLGDARAPPLVGHNADQSFAIGSSFKLWILAELARSTAARERQWSDVVPLGPASLPSGILQKWPQGTAMTLQSLAMLMISISDNTAADTLLAALGRDRVGAILEKTGHHAPTQALPILSTLEAFALKMNGNADVRARWETSNPQGRRMLLDQESVRLQMGTIRLSELGSAPRFINSVEWFSTPSDMARTLDWLRRKGGATALNIMAVNPGIPVGDAARFSYIGFKGGSESGVMSLNFLVQNKAGQWYAVCGSWNDAAAPVDNDRFTSLMIRALALVR